ncbi:MAG: c-type cytochrome [Synoicihabitans sp.]
MRVNRSSFWLVLGLTVGAAMDADTPSNYPAPIILDSNLEVVLFASDPEIVTPTGAATARNGDLFVIESHTHGPPEDYPGPDGDVIKRFRDTNGDGRADEIHVFAEGLQEAMGLAFSPTGELHVVTASDVFRLADLNGDEVSSPDEWDRLIHLETLSGNPHGDLLGVAVADDGSVYVSRGNVGGYPYKWISKTGEEIAGYGEGGDIIRINPDGSDLRVVSTGYWNPYAITFDRFGRLLAADNDPDSVGPNRVVHVIEGSDFGFRARYGPTGLHPFSGWNADLPGTLPIAAGTGEAPSGLLDLTQWGLGDAYEGAFAATVWGEYNLTLYHPQSAGVSFSAVGEEWIRGGEQFRPVALSPHLGGGFFITDWVLKDYPNHLRGAIWLVRPKQATRKPHWPHPLPADLGSASISRIKTSTDFAQLKRHAGSDDPFVRTAAVVALTASASAEEVVSLWRSSNENQRIVAWRVWQRQHALVTDHRVAEALADTSEEVKILGLIHIGDAVAREFHAKVEDLLVDPQTSPRLFRFIIATLQILQSDVDERYTREERGFKIPREIPPALIERVVLNRDLPAPIRALAVPQLAQPLSDDAAAEITAIARQETQPDLLREAMRSLASSSVQGRADILLHRARDSDLSSSLRGDAVSLLAQLGNARSQTFEQLLTSNSAPVRYEAARALRSRGAAAALPPHSDEQAMRTLLEEVDSPVSAESLPEWQALLAAGGDSAAGERVFYETTSMCITCHRVANRGGRIGPDLSNIGDTLSRDQLVRSIIAPSDHVSPEYQGWVIHRQDGTDVIGLQLHLRRDGILIDGLDGVTFKTPFPEIESYETMDKSLMPDGLEQILSAQDLRNLIAFLESLKG